MWEVTSKGKITESAEPLLTDGKFIKGLSGMALVLPAWSIVDSLNTPELRKLRAETEARRQEEYLKNGFPPETASKKFSTLDPRFADDAPVSEAVAPPANGENPKHLEDFTRLVGAAARKPARED
jgi:hypothetical protein